MRFSAREDIEAPIEFVFGELTDFSNFERAAMRRGVDIRREDGMNTVCVGAKWHIGFRFRGKPRVADVEMSQFENPEGYEVSFESGGIEGGSVVELVPLSPQRTRVLVRLDLKPKTLSARLLLQSLKLAKSNLTHRFKTRIADFAEDIETAYTGV